MKEAVCIFCMTGAACTMKDIPDIPVDTKKQKKNKTKLYNYYKLAVSQN